MKHLFTKMSATIIALSVSSIAYAQDVTSGYEQKSPINSITDVQKWLIQATKWGFTFFFILAVAFILMAAYKFLMAKDNGDEVKKATTALKNAAIAIAIALVSAGVSSIISSVLKI